ncbi:MAG: DUF1559 domain-containing protein [Planctomycetota bacterium]|nr:MAG: DUF1559 domain-containing protein [Planctomycetota bacterium]
METAGRVGGAKSMAATFFPVGMPAAMKRGANRGDARRVAAFWQDLDVRRVMPWLRGSGVARSAISSHLRASGYNYSRICRRGGLKSNCKCVRYLKLNCMWRPLAASWSLCHEVGFSPTTMDLVTDRRAPSARRGGFTLVELLIVLLVIGILIAMLFPAVMSIRESARQSQCQVNMRQIGLALRSHMTTRGRFPVNQIGGGSSPQGDCQGGYYSWLVPLLPQVGFEELHDEIDFRESMANNCDQSANDGSISNSHVNAAIATVQIPQFRCPSDPSGASNADVMGSETGGDNYVGNAGWPSNCTGFRGERSTPSAQNGVIALVHDAADIPWMRRRGVSEAEVRDGMTNTAAVSERLVQQGSTIQQIRDSDIRTQSYHITDGERTLVQMNDRCDDQETHSDAIESAYLGRAWISGWSRTGPVYMHVKTPNTINCHFGDQATGDRLVTPSSNHIGGVNLVLADGAVVFIEDDIDREIWWALGSRNGREHHRLSSSQAN